MYATRFEIGDFAMAAMPAPVLNSADFDAVFGGADGKSLALDHQGLLKSVEFILLKSSKVKITGRCGKEICKITTEEYPGEKLFIDARFLDRAENFTPERFKPTPRIEKIEKQLLTVMGLPYVWGGNWSLGIPELLEFYPPKSAISPELQTIWSMRGVDCSGLLYEATSGYTPRNTGQLVHYGLKVAIEEKNVEQIVEKLKPLDLIVWTGHVIIVLDKERAIESRLGKGVYISKPLDRLNEIMSERVPVDDWIASEDRGPRFVIRRWHPETRIL